MLGEDWEVIWDPALSFDYFFFSFDYLSFFTVCNYLYSSFVVNGFIEI